ncbi:MAG TPA: oligosaccharide flippase family protein [Candidatus Saccharimonadales bacterium]|nr:oligosaccharide flippase family protein [Candidatus Saccharimonadales bacterium]
MKQKIINSIKHPLISGSIIVFLGSTLASVFNFIFNLYMSRNLTVSDYGILASLVSILSLALVIANAAVPMIINFAAHYFAKNDLASVRGLFRKVTMYYIYVGAFLFLLFLVFPLQIGKFFNIHQTFLIILCGLCIFIAFIGMVTQALLQAKLSFGFLSVSSFIAALTKLVFGVVFFMIGWGIAGAMGAMFVSLVISYLITFYPLRFLFSKDLHTPTFNMKELVTYGAPAAIASFCVTLFISTDIILIKHFFSPDAAGIYAGLSLVGRVIFFLTSPIGMVMFPLISQKYAKKENYNNTFLLSLIIVLIPSLAITIFYFLFPAYSINIFIKKKEYLQAANLLGFFGIFITVYSLLGVFTSFFLSIKKTKIWIPISLAALAQLILIWLYHQTFLQIITISLTVTSMLLIFFVFYYFRIQKSVVTIQN